MKERRPGKKQRRKKPGLHVYMISLFAQVFVPICLLLRLGAVAFHIFQSTPLNVHWTFSCGRGGGGGVRISPVLTFVWGMGHFGEKLTI